MGIRHGGEGDGGQSGFLPSSLKFPPTFPPPRPGGARPALRRSWHFAGKVARSGPRLARAAPLPPRPRPLPPLGRRLPPLVAAPRSRSPVLPPARALPSSLGRFSPRGAGRRVCAPPPPHPPGPPQGGARAGRGAGRAAAGPGPAANRQRPPKVKGRWAGLPAAGAPPRTPDPGVRPPRSRRGAGCASGGPGALGHGGAGPRGKQAACKSLPDLRESPPDSPRILEGLVTRSGPLPVAA